MTKQTYDRDRHLLILTEAKRLISSAIDNLRLAGPNMHLSLIDAHQAILVRIEYLLKSKGE